MKVRDIRSFFKPSPNSSGSSSQVDKKKESSDSTHQDKGLKSSPSKSSASTNSATSKKGEASESPIPRSKKRQDTGSKLKDRSVSPEMKKASKGSPPKAGPSRKRKASDSEKLADMKSPEEKKQAQRANYFKLMSRGPPKHLGSKEVPVGAPDCLKGITFVQTGTLDSFDHDDIARIIEQYGGRKTSAVSRKTNYLLVGDEPGATKTNKAKELKVPFMTEDEFLDLIRRSNPNAQPAKQTVFGISDQDEDNEAMENADAKGGEVKEVAKAKKGPSPTKKETSEGTTKSKKSVPSPNKSEPSSSDKNKPNTQSSGSSGLGSSTSTNGNWSSSSFMPSVMWVDKYRPRTLKNMVGQVGDRSNSNKLLRWLQNWFQYHGKSDDKAKAHYPGLVDPEGKTLKAVLLSGPPGIGKTTMAHLVCGQLGLDYIELNASDTRNKNGIHDILSAALSSKSLNDLGKRSDVGHMSRRHVLIMDEVDGMSGNQDRGGIQELIALIKSSRVPIICICNDRNHQKIRSLSNYCFDLRCYKPTVEQLKGFIQSICFKEKMKVPYESVLNLIKSTDYDIRQIVNQLELLKATESEGQAVFNPRKDLTFGPWEVCRKVFSASDHAGMSLQDKNNMFFQDYSFGPLFVQENYLKWNPVAAKGSKYKRLDLIKSAAESISTGELVESLIRRSNKWSLLPTQAVFSSILPGEYMEGNDVPGTEFPRWLGKNSHRGKMTRLLQQLHTHVHLQVSGSSEALNLDYLPYLRRSIVDPLVEGDVGDAVLRMQHYNLLREDLDSINEIVLWPGMKNPMDKLDSKTKAAFTRQVNKKVVVPYSVEKVSKGRGKKGGADEDDFLAPDEEGTQEIESEEKDQILTTGNQLCY